ncbi:MAG: SDR family oxidoreductase [Chloroflexi bacterium]|nr:SDR family oxidoreductase [Chloroflexota bacterium]
MTNVLDLFRLDGQVAVVTGGSGNLGSALCSGLAEAGATVVVSSRHLDACVEVARRIQTQGGKSVGLRLDLADDASIEALHDAVLNRFGRVDVLVNNAVSWIPGHVERLPVSDWEAAMRVDATGYFHVTQVFLREMVRQASGNIISIASVLGSYAADPSLYPRGVEGFRPNYFFIKAGMINFTRFLAVTYAAQNIRANCVSPGGLEPAVPGGRSTRWAERTPMRRLAAVSEMRGAVVFLASDASSYVTGHNLVVDGGYTAW